MNDRYYADRDNAVGQDWYIFDSKQEPHKAIESYSDKDEAVVRTEKLNSGG